MASRRVSACKLTVLPADDTTPVFSLEAFVRYVAATIGILSYLVLIAAPFLAIAFMRNPVYAVVGAVSCLLLGCIAMAVCLVMAYAHQSFFQETQYEYAVFPEEECEESE